MATRQAVSGKVLAEFAADIDDDEGWWFRAPKDPSIGVKEPPKSTKHPDGIMPQLGSLFFLEESAILAMLHQIGCYRMKGEKFVFNLKGWENLRYKFRVPSSSRKISGCLEDSRVMMSR
jgi:hypothetical protein